jgi:hypothetical protein
MNCVTLEANTQELKKKTCCCGYETESENIKGWKWMKFWFCMGFLPATGTIA